MQPNAGPKRILFPPLILGAVFVLSLIGFLGLALYVNVRVIDYPGADIVSQHFSTHFRGHPYFRQDVSYRSADDFPVVYNWYSTGFDLGPEKHAISSCILMENTAAWFVFTRHMSVILCDAQSGRRIFVERTLSLHMP